LFQPEDLVWVHLRKERFPSKRRPKLMPRANGPFELLKKVNDSAYKINLLRDYGVPIPLMLPNLNYTLRIISLRI